MVNFSIHYLCRQPRFYLPYHIHSPVSTTTAHTLRRDARYSSRDVHDNDDDDDDEHNDEHDHATRLCRPPGDENARHHTARRIRDVTVRALQSFYYYLLIDHLPYIVDFRSAVRLPYDHRSVANTDTRSAPNKQGRACFFPYGAQCGRRAPSTTGKYATRRKRWRSPSSGARIGVDEIASSDTMLRLSYDNIMVLWVNRPSTRQ